MVLYSIPLYRPAYSRFTGYTKLRVWGLTQYKRVVYIDADTLVVDSVDEVTEERYGGDRGHRT